MRIDADRHNVEQNVLKARRRGPDKSYLNLRLRGGPGRYGSSQQQANNHEKGQGQAKRNPMHKKIFHSESITEEFGQRLG